MEKDIQEYIKPQIIYVPLESKNGVTYKHLVKEGDYVFKGDVVAINESINFPLHSSISGYVVRGTTKIINNGKRIKCVAIENDFKEKYRDKIGTKRNIGKYTKNEFINLLKNSGITGLGGSDFPTFIKYDTKLKYLLVNGVESEPYVSCDKAVMSNYMEEILECIDKMVNILELKRAYIVVKEDNIDILNKVREYIGTYPNIEIYTMPNSYISGWERNIIKRVLKLKYDKYPSEIGVVVQNVSTIYAIYEMLKYNRPLTERIITIRGNGVNKEINVKVKIGALISEIIENIGGYKEIENPILIAGGLIRGNSLPTDELLVTKDLNCITIDNYIKEISYPCINCGKCSNICPVNLIPVFIMKNYNNKNKLKYLKPNKCIECGLCSYICPSKIELMKYVKMSKDVNNNEEI